MESKGGEGRGSRREEREAARGGSSEGLPGHLGRTVAWPEYGPHCGMGGR